MRLINCRILRELLSFEIGFSVCVSFDIDFDIFTQIAFWISLSTFYEMYLTDWST